MVVDDVGAPVDVFVVVVVVVVVMVVVAVIVLSPCRPLLMLVTWHCHIGVAVVGGH